MSCTILSNVNLITSRVELAFKNSKCVTNYPKIVAVSKFKTIENIIEAYNCGLRFFGENYVQELLKKAQDEKVITNCPDIKWHFIGKLQSKNVNKILRVPNLYVIETLESIDIAKSLNEKLGNLERKEKLKVMIQINASGAEAKGGISPDEVVEFTSKIIQNFENLNFIGLMTIGAIHNVIEGSSNPDFVTLYDCREQVCKALNLSSDDVQLSMGMSNDFEHAIMMGSTNVRIGSSIFGERN